MVDDKVLLYPLLIVVCGLLGGALSCLVEVLSHKYRDYKKEKSNEVAECHGDFLKPEFEFINMTDLASPRPYSYGNKMKAVVLACRFTRRISPIMKHN